MRRFFGRLLLGVMVLLALFAIEHIVVTIKSGHKKEPPVSAPQAATTPSSPDDKPLATEKDPQSGKASERALKAVDAGASVVDLLTKSVLLPSSDRRNIIRLTVYRRYRAAQAAAIAAWSAGLPPDNTPQWKSWGYGSAQEALFKADYGVQTKKYHIDRLSRRTARISLYVWTHWKAALDLQNNTQHNVPSITVVNLRWANGRWLYIGQEDPPPDKTPHFTQADRGLSLADWVKRFTHYLKDYTAYEQKGPETVG
jgi:hypothetical protein